MQIWIKVVFARAHLWRSPPIHTSNESQQCFESFDCIFGPSMLNLLDHCCQILSKTPPCFPRNSATAIRFSNILFTVIQTLIKKLQFDYSLVLLHSAIVSNSSSKHLPFIPLTLIFPANQMRRRPLSDSFLGLSDSRGVLLSVFKCKS